MTFSVYNCILEYSLYLIGVSVVNISYTTENIFRIEWKRLFEKRI